MNLWGTQWKSMFPKTLKQNLNLCYILKLFIWLYTSSSKLRAPLGHWNELKTTWAVVWLDHVFDYWLYDLGPVIFEPQILFHV